MAYKPADRNYENVQFQRTRELWDEYYIVADDAISAAYYDYWRQGVVHEISFGSGATFITTLDIDAGWNAIQIKQFFDDLQKELHHEYWLGFGFWNETGIPDDQIHKSEWDYIYELDPASPDPENPDYIWLGATNTDLANTTLADMEVNGIRNCKEYFSKWH